MDEKTIKELAWEAWKGAANAYRLYPERKHTFTDYWSANRGHLMTTYGKGGSTDKYSVVDHHGELFLHDRTNNNSLVGKISPAANWVKEGDTFKEEEIRREIWRQESPVIFIKCSKCNIFH